MKDAFNRKIDYLRISVTDKCDLRCVYCMPECGVESLTHEDILSFEEMTRLVKCFADLGISKIKITGGEPLVRRNVVELIGELKSIPGIEKVTMTTNGTYLAEFIDELSKMKIDGINISMDTLNPKFYEKITRRDSFFQVFEGFKKALAYSDIQLKINCVPMGIPEQDLVEVAGLAKKYPVHVRFIEMMPIGLGKKFPYMSEAEVMQKLDKAYGTLEPSHEALGNGPCRYYNLAGFQGKIGFISAMSHKFCSSCNRVRLTADGRLKTCLQYDVGVNLKEMIRSGKSDEELKEAILQALKNKPGEHHFTEEHIADRETKSMFQIGG